MAERDRDLYALERDIRGLPEILACRVLGRDAIPERIELLIRPGSQEEMVLEHVRDLVRNSTGTAVPEEQIGTATLPWAAGELAAPLHDRPRLEAVTYREQERRGWAEVALHHRGRELRGQREGVRSNRQRLRLVAEAALLAAESIAGQSDLFALEDVSVVQLADSHVVVVLVHAHVDREELLLTGSARPTAQDDLDSAVVRAVLTALNRLLVRYT